MNKCIQRIVEGFFGNQPVNTRNTPVIGIRQQLVSKLQNLMPITQDEWDFINDCMGGCISADNDTLKGMCSDAIRVYGNNVSLNWIDTSDVRKMDSTFEYQFGFAGNGIGCWDVSHVTSMSHMFDGCSKFNCDISQWDVSNVTDMHSMFEGCSAFNSCISTWNVSNVTNMGQMFQFCSSFDSSISGWDVSKVINMHAMFEGCSKFNCDISQWDVSSVTDMGRMFWECIKFNSDLSMWDVSRVEYMEYMFQNCHELYTDLSRWDVANVKDMSRPDDRECLFFGCYIPRKFKPKFNGKK